MTAARLKSTTRPAQRAPAAAAPQAVATRVARGRAQCQSALRVSSFADPAEAEARATAQSVVRQPGPTGTAPSLPDGALPRSVRSFMEPRFGADFSGVRVHSGERAATLSRQLNARAFTVGNDIFFGRDQFRPHSEEGRELIAHELTHIIQQGAVVQNGGSTVVQRSALEVQRFGVGDALEYFAGRANQIPGFRMLTLVLGVNPITMTRVERTTANLTRAVIEFIPGGALMTQALDNYGVFDRIAARVEEQLRALQVTAGVIKQAITAFLGSLRWSDILHPQDLWSRAVTIVTEPIRQVIAFAGSLATGIVKFIKDVMLRPLAKLAQGMRGYDLLRAVLSRDPITAEPYPRTAETLIGGFMHLIGEDEVWNNLQRSNAVPRAWAWFQGAMGSLSALVREVPARFVNALESLEVMDIVLLPKAFAKVAGVFGSVAGAFVGWAGSAVWGLLEIIFDVVAPGALPYLKKTATAFRTILRDPIRFAGNLVRAGRLGFEQFAGNIGQHLQTSLIQWLTGSLSGTGIYVPQSFDIREIIKFVLSVLGITWQTVRQKLVRALGETVVRTLETGFDIVVTLVTQGPAAAWEQIKEQVSNLKELVIDQIMSFVQTKIVQSAVTKLVTMLNPAGAVIQAILAIYNTIMFFVERLSQIAQVTTAFLDSMGAIASGVVTAAAIRVEQTLAGVLTLAISFLARIAGLGNVTDAVTSVLNKIRAPIDRALDKVADWIVNAARRVVSGVKGAAGRVMDWWRRSLPIGVGKDAHILTYEGETEDAELVLRTSPTRVERALAAIKDEKNYQGKRKQDAIAATLGLVEDARQFRRRAREARRNGNQQLADQHAATVDKRFDEIGVQLGIAFTGDAYGTEDDPIPLEWPGPASSAYTSLYFGGRLRRKRKQSDMRTMVGQKDELGVTIREYRPTERNPLPDEPDETQIGLDVILRKDSVVGPLGTETTPGGGKLRRLIAPYGYDSGDDGTQLDHVQEIQLGGRDEVGNLWPLESARNARKGSKLARAAVPYPKGSSATLAIPELKRIPPPDSGRKKGFYFRITSVES